MKEEGLETHLLIHTAGVKQLENKINYSTKVNTKKTCFSTGLKISLFMSPVMTGKTILRDLDHVSSMQIYVNNLRISIIS